MRILFDLRPALAGHAGIPQETRLLFRMLADLASARVDGLLQGSHQVLPDGPTDLSSQRWTDSGRHLAAARTVAALADGGGRRVRRLVGLGLRAALSVSAAQVGHRQRLVHLIPRGHEAQLWQALFARTLEDADFERLMQASYRVARMPWSTAHAGGLLGGRVGMAGYPRLDTQGYDVLIAQTPYPGRVTAPTRLVIRYHDAVPMLLAHTTRMRDYDREMHRLALQCNVRDGAWFACVSEATRRDLVRLFPQAELRAEVLPNLVSPLFRAEVGPAVPIESILGARAHLGFGGEPAAKASTSPPENAPAGAPRYLLMVSTLEPRKNHAVLIDAWERLRRTSHPGLRLVLVGSIGWHCEPIVERLRPWIAQGAAHLLGDVPAHELRQLYRGAAVTVCPSLWEGFGYSGVEALSCGGAVVASDLPVHREVYGDAAVYFATRDVDALVSALMRVTGPESNELRGRLAQAARDVAARYDSAALLPRWDRFLRRVLAQ